MSSWTDWKGLSASIICMKCRIVCDKGFGLTEQLRLPSIRSQASFRVPSIADTVVVLWLETRSFRSVHRRILDAPKPHWSTRSKIGHDPGLTGQRRFGRTIRNRGPKSGFLGYSKDSSRGRGGYQRADLSRKEASCSSLRMSYLSSWKGNARICVTIDNHGDAFDEQIE